MARHWVLSATIFVYSGNTTARSRSAGRCLVAPLARAAGGRGVVGGGGRKGVLGAAAAAGVASGGVSGLSAVATSPGRRAASGRAAMRFTARPDAGGGGGGGTAVVVAGTNGVSGAVSRTDSGNTPSGKGFFGNDDSGSEPMQGMEECEGGREEKTRTKGTDRWSG